MASQNWLFATDPVFGVGETLNSTEHGFTIRTGLGASFVPQIVAGPRAGVPNIGALNFAVRNAGPGVQVADVYFNGAPSGFGVSAHLYPLVCFDAASWAGWGLMLFNATSAYLQRIDAGGVANLVDPGWGGLTLSAANTSCGLKYNPATNTLTLRIDGADTAKTYVITQHTGYRSCGIASYSSGALTPRLSMTGANFGVNPVQPADFVNARVYPVLPGQTYAAMRLKGTHTGIVGAVDFKVVYAASGVSVPGFDWQALIASPAASGAFSLVKNIPVGGPYQILYRDSAAPASEYSSGNTWCVGYSIYGWGQSNTIGLRQGVSAAAVDPLAFVFGVGNSWSPMAQADGPGVVAMMNKARALLGPNVPIGLILRGQGATGIAGFLPGSALNLQYMNDIVVATATDDKPQGDLSLIFSVQGESDTGLGAFHNTPANYVAAEQSIYTELLTRTGRAAAELPYLVTVIGRNEGGTGNDQGWQNIRKAKMDWAGAQASVDIACQMIDLIMADALHPTVPLGYEEQGRRIGRSIAKALGANVYSGAGPFISAVSLTGSVVTVTVNLDGNAPLSGSPPLTAWHVSDDDFATQITITATALQGTDRIVLTLAAAPANPANVKVRYLFGQDPDVSSLVGGSAA
jgi:hypothetical protein